MAVYCRNARSGRSSGVRREGSLATPRPVRPLHVYVNDDPVTWSRPADVVRNAGVAVIIGPAVMLAVDRLVMGHSRDLGLGGGFHLD